jgi:hypothetical protein
VNKSTVETRPATIATRVLSWCLFLWSAAGLVAAAACPDLGGAVIAVLATAWVFAPVGFLCGAVTGHQHGWDQGAASAARVEDADEREPG